MFPHLQRKRLQAECQQELELVKSADKLGYRTIEEVGGNPKKQVYEQIELQMLALNSDCLDCAIKYN